jgi:hypothetical protein
VLSARDADHAPECRAVSGICRTTTGCADAGACWFVDGRCAPRTEADCRNSNQCKSIGNCKLARVADTMTCSD